MRRIGRIGLLCLVVALGVSVALASSAAAKRARTGKKARAGSQITIASVGPDGAAGRVSSGDNACRPQRQVLLYRVNSGPSIPTAEFVASTWTHGDGSWEVPGPLYPSQFFAVVEAKNAKRVVCASDTSNAPAWG